MPYEYRLIPAPRRAKRAKGARTPADRYARTLTDVINDQAAEGWEYLRADTMPVEEKKGVLGSATETLQTLLVFRRATAPARGTVEPRMTQAIEDPAVTKLSLGPAQRRE